MSTDNNYFLYGDSEKPTVIPSKSEHKNADGSDATLFVAGEWTFDEEDLDPETARSAALAWIAWAEYTERYAAEQKNRNGSWD